MPTVFYCYRGLRLRGQPVLGLAVLGLLVLGLSLLAPLLQSAHAQRPTPPLQQPELTTAPSSQGAQVEDERVVNARQALTQADFHTCLALTGEVLAESPPRQTALLARYWQARAYLEQEKWMAAWLSLNTLLRMPQAPRAAYYWRAVAKHRLGMVQSALQDLQTADTLPLQQAWAEEDALSRGRAYQRLQQAEAASKAFQAALTYNPNNHFAHLGLGEVALAANQLEAARHHLNQALIHGRQDERVYLRRAYLLEQRNRYRDCVLELDQALHQDSTHPQAHRNRGYCLFKLKKYAEAVESYRRSLQHGPGEATTLVNLAMAYLYLEDTLLARQHLAEAMEADPASPGAHSNLGMLALQVDQPGRALQCYNRAIELGLNNADHYSNRGVALEQTGQLQAALADFTRALELRPEAHTYYLRGRVYLKLGRPAAACNDLAEARRSRYGPAEKTYQQHCPP